MAKKEVTLITPTGFRPEAFSLCEYYMSCNREVTNNEVQWIVIDDSKDTKVTKGQEYYPSPFTWKPGMNTQAGNLLSILDKIEGEYIFFIEDDDYYAWNYLSKMLLFIRQFDYDIVGEGNAKYYHVGRKAWKCMHNYSHASLCQTAIHRRMLPLLRKALISGDTFFDITLWRLAQAEERKSLIFSNELLCVGLKGLPGRTGIGVGHSKLKDYTFDVNYNKLKEWIGDDYERYEKFATPVEPVRHIAG